MFKLEESKLVMIFGLMVQSEYDACRGRFIAKDTNLIV